MLITECCPLVLAAHAISADLYVSHDGRLASPDGARTIDLSDFQAFALIRCGYP
jgi:hypothetical protein